VGGGLPRAGGGGPPGKEDGEDDANPTSFPLVANFEKGRHLQKGIVISKWTRPT